MDLDFFFGTSSAPPSKPPPQPAASNAYDFFPPQQQQQSQPQQGFSQQSAYSQQQGGYPQPYAQQPYSQQPFAPLGGYPSQPGFGAPQPNFASSQPAYGGQSAFYGQAPAPAYPQQSGAALLPQSSTKPVASNNNDFFDMFGGDFGAKPAAASQPQAQPQAQAQPAAQPQTIQFSNDDFLDLLGAPSSATAQQPAVVSRPAAAAAAVPSPVTTQPSTFKRGQSKKDAAAKKDLNLDAFSQLAVSRQKSPVAASTPTTKKIAESESESESESEDDDDDVRGARNIDDDEQNMGTGQGFTPIDHQARSGGQSGGGSAKKCVAADCNNTFHGAGRFCAAHQRYENAPAESKDADGRKVKGEWSIERKRTGTKMGFIKNITIWKFYFKGEQHTVELRHSTFSGKRVILVDRRQLLSEKRLIGGDAAHKVFAGSDFETRCEVTVVIKSNNDRFQYGIFIEGLPIRDAKLKYVEYV